MKIYIVKEDNGQDYEDYEEWIISVYFSKENAKKEVKNLRAKEKKSGHWYKHNYYIEEFTTKDSIDESK